MNKEKQSALLLSPVRHALVFLGIFVLVVTNAFASLPSDPNSLAINTLGSNEGWEYNLTPPFSSPGVVSTTDLYSNAENDMLALNRDAIESSVFEEAKASSTLVSVLATPTQGSTIDFGTGTGVTDMIQHSTKVTATNFFDSGLDFILSHSRNTSDVFIARVADGITASGRADDRFFFAQSTSNDLDRLIIQANEDVPFGIESFDFYQDVANSTTTGHASEGDVATATVRGYDAQNGTGTMVAEWTTFTSSAPATFESFNLITQDSGFGNVKSIVFDWSAYNTTEENNAGTDGSGVDGVSQVRFDNIVLSTNSPVVQSISPTHRSANIAQDANIEITFSKAIDGSTLNASGIRIEGSNSGPIAGTWSGGGSNTVTFTPSRPFFLGEKVVVEVLPALLSTTAVASVQASYSFTVKAGLLKGLDSWTTKAFTFDVNGVGVNGPRRLAVGDLESDGDLDFIIASNDDNTIRLATNTSGTSTETAFTTEILATNANSVSAVAFEDIDGDGDLDVVFAASGNGRVDWLDNQNGTFVATNIATNAGQFRDVAVADVDGDGDKDIITVSVGNNIVRFYKNDGNQGFSGSAIASNLSNPNSVTIAHLASTGNPHIIVTSYVDDRVNAYRFENGAFVTATRANGVNGAISTAVGDLTGDGIPEIVSAAHFVGKLYVHTYDEANNAIGSGTEIASGLTSIQTVQVYDMDGDGDLDVIASATGKQLIEWYQNDGSGNFTAVELKIGVDAGVGSHFLLGDFSNKGYVELLAADQSRDKVVLYSPNNIAPKFSIDVSTASYAGASEEFSVGGQEVGPTGMTFNSDGTKMFVIGSVDAAVVEYNLSPGYDVSTASYAGASEEFYVGSQESLPQDMTFNSDGTKMFIIGSADDAIVEYNLSTEYDVSTASYAGPSEEFSVRGEEEESTGIAFNSDGTKMFIIGILADAVFEYNLSTGFDVSTAVYAGESEKFSVKSQEGFSRGMIFSNDGTKMFIVGTINASVIEYNLSIGYDVSTAVHAGVIEDFSVGSQELAPYGITFNPGGTKMFIIGTDGDAVVEYTLGSISIAENSTGVTYDMSANNGVGGLADVDITYAIVGGADSGDFTINTTTGELSFVSAPNFEAPTDANTDNVYEIIVQAQDDGASFNNTARIPITITVTNVVEPMTVVSQIPAANATNISTSTNIEITFDYELDASTVSTLNMVVRGQYSGNIGGQWSAAGAVATFTPTYLEAGEVIHVELETGVKSASGESLHANTNYSFTVAPTNNATLGSYWAAASGVEANPWQSITYGDGRFVAVAGTGTNRIMYSGDGETWTAGSASEANNWVSVTYGHPKGTSGRYVAVSDNGTNQVMYSNNGINWTAAAAPEVNDWKSITYGNGRFVAIATSGTNRVMFSDDGRTWTAAAATEASFWRTVTYGNGRFVAVSSGGTNRVMYSENGETWTAATAAEANSWLDITYGNGLFVAVSANGTNRVMYSVDGINWTAASAAEANNWQKVTYGNGRFVAVSNTGTNRVMHSEDGITWTASPATEANSWLSVTYGYDRFVAVSANGTNRVMYTIPWSVTTTSPASNATNINPDANMTLTFNGNPDPNSVNSTNIIVRGQQSGVIAGVWSVDGAIATFNPTSNLTAGEVIHVELTTNVSNTEGANLATRKAYSFTVTPADNVGLGESWAATTATEQNLWSSITYGNPEGTSGRFVAVSYSGENRVMHSDDGFTWTAASATEQSNWWSVTYGNGRYVAVSQDGTDRVMYSDNGINWTAATAPGANAWMSVSYGNGLFVAVSKTGTNRVIYSEDGQTWTVASASDQFPWWSVTYGNGRFVAASATNNRDVSSLMYSDDGQTWTLASPPGNAGANNFVSVAYGNGRFVAVSSSSGKYNIMHSEDGINWTAVAEANQWMSVAYGNGRFVAVTYNGTNGTNRVLYSEDGQTWTATQAAEANTWVSIAFGNGKFVSVSRDGKNRVMFTGEAPIANPTLVSSIPASNSTNISADSDITLTFSEELNATTVSTQNIIVRGQQSGVIAGVWSVDGAVATFNPTADFTAGEVIHVELTTDIASAEGAKLETPKAYSFTVLPANNADLGENWKEINDGSSGSWTSITYGKGKFVAVAGFGQTRLMYSDDGENWSVSNTIAESEWQSVTYGNGRFVAVAQSGAQQVAYSDNGEEWSYSDPAATNQWQSVTYGNNLFVAVSQNGDNRAMYSADGITWQLANAPEARSWKSVTYGNGRFVAVSSGRLMYSEDGQNWVVGTTPVSSAWASVVYGNGQFVAIAGFGDGNRLMTSNDGIAWEASGTNEQNSWRAVTYGNGRFIAVASSGDNRVMYSDDARTWSNAANVPQKDWRSAAYGNGKFVALAYTGQYRIMVTAPAPAKPTLVSSIPQANSTNINAASDITLTFSEALNASTVSTQNIIVRGQQSGAIAGVWSVDGAVATFNPTANLTAGEVIHVEISSNVKSSNDVGLAPTAYSFTVAPENNADLGKNWVSASATEANEWRSITYGNGRFVAITNDGTNLVMYSDDGITWTSASAAEAQDWISVTYGNGRFVAVAFDFNNRVMYSDDGENWISVAGAEANLWKSVTYGNGRFVAVAESGTNRVMYSDDGATWIAAAHAGTNVNSWNNVAYGNGRYIAQSTSTTNPIMYSENGQNWTAVETVAAIEANQRYSIAYGNGKFVGVAQFGENSIIYSEDNGLTWAPIKAPSANPWRSIAFGNGRFVAVSDIGDNRVMYSDDGVTWALAPSSESSKWGSVTYGNGRFVAVSISGTNRVMYTAEPTSAKPTLVSSSPANNATKVSYFDEVILRFNQVVTIANVDDELLTISINGVEETYQSDDDDLDLEIEDEAVLFELPDFDYNSEYVLTIGAGLIKNESGELNEEFSISFSTSLQPPSILTFDPASNSVLDEVPEWHYAKFNQAVQLLSTALDDSVKADVNGIEYRLKLDFGATKLGIANDSSVAVQGVPGMNIPGATVNIYIGKTIANSDDVGNDTDYIWRYSLSTPAPALTSSTPANNATKVSTTDSLVFKFDKVISLVDATKIRLSSGVNLTPISEIRVTNDSLIITHEGLLAQSEYEVFFQKGAIANGVGLANEDLSISFTTSLAAPKVYEYSHEPGSVKEFQSIMLIGLTLDQAVSRVNVQVPDSALVKINGVTKKFRYNDKAERSDELAGFDLSDSLILIFTAENDIPPGSDITITIGAGHYVNSDNVPNEEITWSFRVALEKPTIVSTSPSNGATKVGLGDTIIVKYSVPITIKDASKIVLSDSDSDIAFESIRVSGDSLILVPSELQGGKSYTLRFEFGLLVNADDIGNGSTTRNFQTIQAAPLPIVFYPEDGAVQVPVDASLSVKFDQLIFFHSQSQGSGTADVISDGVTYGDLPITITDSTAGIDFDLSVLGQGKDVTVRINAKFQAFISNADDVLPDDFTWTFKTAAPDPVIISSVPANKATKVSKTDSLVFKFDQIVTLVDASLVTIMEGQNAITPSFVKVRNDSLIVGPNAFADGTNYSVTVRAGVVKSQSDLLNLESKISFRTLQTAPLPLAFYPGNSAVNVIRDTSMIVVFDQPVKKYSGAQNIEATVTVKGTTYNIPVSLQGSRATLDFNTDNFIGGELVTISFSNTTTRITNEDDVIIEPFSWSFTTLEASSAPQIVSTNPSANATAVSVSSDIEINFNENVIATQINGNDGYVTLYKNDKSEVERFVTGNLAVSGSKVTVNPTADLEYSNTYYLLIDQGSFQNTNNVDFGGLTDVNTIRFTTPDKPNTSPMASNVSSTGNLEVNQNLSGSYFYSDADSDAESGTTFQWYAADDATGANSAAISSATATTYKLTANEEGKFIAFGVTPNDGKGAGTDVLSTYQGPILAAVIPTLVSTTPVDGAVDIAISADLSFVLSESVTKGTGNIKLTPVSGGETQIAVTSDEVTVAGATMTIKPTVELVAGQFYTVTFDATAFVDADGNNSAGLSSQTTWNFTTKAANVAPVASGVTLKKSLVVDGTLEGSYTYSDANDDTESGTTFKWYRADDAAGTNKTAITGATSQTYIVVSADDGKFISFEVTPNDGTLSGTAAESVFFGPIIINNGTNNIPPAFTSDALTSIKDNETYSYTVTYEDLNNDVPVLTKTTGPAWLSVTGFILSGSPTTTNVGDHAVLLTLDDQNGGTVTQSFTVTVTVSNTAPSVSGVEISGTTTISEVLTGSYNFIDAESDADNSTYKWFRADDNTGTGKTEISGATETTYTLTAADAGKFIAFEVISNDGKVAGTLATSAYSTEVLKKKPTLSLAAITKTYGDAAFDLAATTNSSGAVTYTFDNDQTAANITGTTVTLGNVGKINVNISLAADAEYQARQVTSTITVNKRPIEFTATNASKAYGAADPSAFTYTVTSGSLVDDAEVVVVSRDAGEAVGTYAISFSNGSGAGNFDITTVNGTFTIEKAPITITADAATKVYGASDPTFTYNITTGALLNADVLSGAITRDAGENVGTYALKNSLFNGNYAISFASADLTVTKKNLTATAADKQKSEGEANPELTISYNGFVSGEDASVLDAAPTISTAATTSSAPGTYDITLSGGSDNNYAFTLVNGTLTINAAAVNNAPTVVNAITNKTEAEGFGSKTVDLTNVFADADSDVLTFTASSSFEEVATVSVSGNTLTYTEVAVGATPITVTANDGNGGTVTDDFTITINAVAVNNAPTVANAITDKTEDEGFGSNTVDLTDVFTDADSDALTYSATSSSEAIGTVSITGSTLTYTEVGVGITTITVTANDGNGGTVSDDFSITINAVAVNNAPTVANAITDKTEDEGFGSNTVDLTDVFTDADSDALTYSATSSSEAIGTVSITGSTLTYTEVGVGITTITVTANDGNGGTVSDDFSITINAVAVNNAPTVANAITDKTEDEGFGSNTVDLTDVFTDADSDALTYSATSSSEAIGTVSITGSTLTYTEVGVGVTTITVTANDGNGGTVSDDFSITINAVAVNNAPTVANAITDKTEDEGFGSNTVDLTDVFTDADSDALTYSATSSSEAIGTVSITGSTLTYTEVGVGVTTITVTANDGNGGTVSDDFTITINAVAVNNAPTVANAITDKTEDEGFGSNTVDLTDVFTDADGDLLTYTVTSSDASIATADVSGTELRYFEESNGVTTITVLAEDGRGGSISEEFTLTINSPRVPPEAEIPQGFSPNGDGINDMWQIPNIGNYPNNTVTIFDRQGNKVYQASGYNNNDVSFEGLASAGAINTSRGLSDGVYYYVIDLGNGEQRKGHIIIKQ